MVVDYRDIAGIRRRVTSEKRWEAEAALVEKLPNVRWRTVPVLDPNITVGAYAGRWLGLIAASVKTQTLTAYCKMLRCHILPALGTLKIREVSRGQIKTLLAQKLAVGLARNTVQAILAVLRTMLEAAVDEEIITTNPAARLGRQLRLAQTSKARQEETKAMTREQLTQFLSTAARVDPQHYPLWLTLCRSGLRLGETRGLRWEDLNFSDREIRVARSLGERGEVGTPKSGYGRTVDMSQELARVLLGLQVVGRAETLLREWGEMPPWVFRGKHGGPLDRKVVGKAFKRVLKVAGLSLHFTPHCLRHTYASLLIQMEVSPVYVQQQLGHSSIKLTVDTYGKWLRVRSRGSVDRLDEVSGSNHGIQQ